MGSHRHHPKNFIYGEKKVGVNRPTDPQKFLGSPQNLMTAYVWSFDNDYETWTCEEEFPCEHLARKAIATYYEATMERDYVPEHFVRLKGQSVYMLWIQEEGEVLNPDHVFTTKEEALEVQAVATKKGTVSEVLSYLKISKDNPRGDGEFSKHARKLRIRCDRCKTMYKK